MKSSSVTILKNDLKRFWLLMVPYFLLFFSLLNDLRGVGRWTYNFAVEQGASAAELYQLAVERAAMFHQNILDVAELSVIFAAITGLIAAFVMFSYLYKNRPMGLFHVLPISREKLFLTHFISGLVWPLVVKGLVFLVIFLLEMGGRVSVTGSLLQWLAYSSLHFVFFYCLAVFCAVLVGNIAGLAVTFATLSFAIGLIQQAMEMLLGSVLLGFPGFEGVDWFRWLSPAQALTRGSQVDGGGHFGGNTWVGNISTDVWYETPVEVGVNRLVGWHIFIIYAAIGLGLAVAALLIYRKRHSETAGDFIAVRVLRRVFPYLLAIGAALVGGVFGFAVSRPGFPIWVYLGLVVGGLIGIYAAHVLLTKKFRVFGRMWRQAAVVAGVLILLLGTAHVDLFGFAGRIPEIDTVTTAHVRLSFEGTLTFEEPQNIAAVHALHQTIIRRGEGRQHNRGWDIGRAAGFYSSIHIGYTLQDGSEFWRKYLLPVWQAHEGNTETPTGQLEALIATPEAQNTQVAAFTDANISIELHWWGGDDDEMSEWVSGSLTLEYEEARALWENAILPDIQDGNIEMLHFGFSSRRLDIQRYQLHLSISISEIEETPRGIRHTTTRLHIDPTENATRTLAHLQELDVPLIPQPRRIYQDGDWVEETETTVTEITPRVVIEVE